MRTIKFRGRDKTGKWHYGYLLTMHSPDRLFIMDKWHSIGGEATIKDELFMSTVEIDPETAGQFIGRLDKNGKEVFEGDLIRYGDSIYEVKYYPGRFEGYKNGILSMYFYPENESHYEVIGNIYENGDLLEKRAKNE